MKYLLAVLDLLIIGLGVLRNWLVPYDDPPAPARRRVYNVQLDPFDHSAEQAEAAQWN